MPQLRYELIGDASQFQKAGSDLVSSAEQMEGALEGLEANISSLTDGQLRYNQAAERFRDASGQFVSGAEAQSAALKELNSEGVETAQQIREQIDRLERLEDVYSEDAVASRELANQQQRLRTELAEVGAASAQQERSLRRLDESITATGQQFSFATVEMQGFANRQERLQQELRATAAAQDQVQSSSVTMRSSVSASANNLGFEFAQAAQDATFGIQGVANQIPLMTEQFSQLQSKAGSTRGALTALKNSLMGPAGLIGAGTVLLSLGPQIISWLTGAEDAASDAEAEFRGFFNTIGSGVQNLDSLSKSLPSVSEELDQFGAAEGAGGVVGFFRDFQRVGDVQAVQKALRETGEESRFLENMLEAMGANINQILSEDMSAALEEVTQFREEIMLLSEDSEAAIQEFPGAFAEQAREQFQSVQEEQQDLVEANITTQEDALQEQQSFLEDALTQARTTLSAEQFESNFGGLQQQLFDVRRELTELESSGEEAAAVFEAGEWIIDAENMQFTEELPGLWNQTEQSIQGAREETESLQSQLEQLQGPQGLTLARARERREEMQRQVNQARQLTRAIVNQNVARQQGDQPGQVREVPTGVSAGISGMTPDQIQGLTERQRARRQRLSEVVDGAGDEIEQGVNQNLTQGIQLASQLGATLIQAAQGSEAEWNRVLGSVLGTIGGIVSMIPGGQVAGAAIAGGGTLVGSFEEGGTMPRTGLAELHPPEIVTGLPGGAQVVARDDTMDMLASSQTQRVDVNISGDMIRMGPRNVGIAIREDNKRRERHT